MSVRLKPVSKQVVVITGATSGIGLATALAAAREGARLVLTARNEHALDDVARRVASAGGHGITVPADVSDRDQVERVAAEALRHYGGFDTWVNNAGLSIFGKLEQISEADHRRMFDVNFWGVVHGSLAALPTLKKRGGALINLGSVASDLAIPMQAMYSVTKAAIRSFTDGLRMELQADGAPVSVTLIKPHGIDTPFTKHAKNYMSEEAKLPDPAYPPEDVARAILHAAAHGGRDIFVGGAGRVMSAAGRQAPELMDWMSRNFMIPQQKRPGRPNTTGDGALYLAGDDGDVHGGHPGVKLGTSLYTRAVINPAVLWGAFAVGAGVLLAATGGAAAARTAVVGRRSAAEESMAGAQL